MRIPGSNLSRDFGDPTEIFHSFSQNFKDKVNITIYLSIYGSTDLLLDLGRFFQFLNPIHSREDSLDGGSAIRKAATYTQNNTNTE
jgi:hypothetical protein